MGMFDTVWFMCPECGHLTISAQSKAGQRELEDICADAVPAVIAEDLNGVVEGCTNCNTITTLRRVSPPGTVRMKAVVD